ncbi:MAG: galactose mutarotase [Clostridium sp.]|nr:galactose mutarotase [Clostridium sp.]
MAVTKRLFDTLADGRAVDLYSITNRNGMCVEVMTYGANIVNLFLPGENDERVDVTMGYDTIEPYTVNTDNFGATIGPNCNRIADASFVLEGKKIQMAVNDGVNNLHSDAKLSMAKKLWDAQTTEDSVIFSVRVGDGEVGLPGNKVIRLTYTLTDENELKLHYEGKSDQNTIINLTNHAYFNLSGHAAGSIHDAVLWVNASQFTEVRAGGIPTGRILPVKGTALDFTQPKPIGRDIDGDDEQTKLVGGYDHNWVLNDWDGQVRLAARLTDEKAKRQMEVYTNLPGMQIYAGNFIGKQAAKGGAVYEPRMGIAMETQFFPDAPNHDNFPSTVFGPERQYDSTTIYKFIF